MKQYNTAIVGLGAIGSYYSEDIVMSKTVKYATHAHSITSHSGFDLVAGVDNKNSNLEVAKRLWNIPELRNSIENLPNLENIEVAVLATGPEYRLDAIKLFPNLKAVVLEKPTSTSIEEGNLLETYCKNHNILVQVNLTRRTDQQMINLSNKNLMKKIGKLQAITGIYGNGLLNNATHMIDLVRMIAGEIKYVQALNVENRYLHGPIKDDLNVSFLLILESGVSATFNAINFNHYRENSIDIWGTKGRLEIIQEGLLLRYSFTDECRSCSGKEEINANKSIFSNTEYSDALYNLYSNLYLSLEKKDTLASSLRSALISEKTSFKILDSVSNDGELIKI